MRNCKQFSFFLATMLCPICNEENQREPRENLLTCCSSSPLHCPRTRRDSLLDAIRAASSFLSTGSCFPICFLLHSSQSLFSPVSRCAPFLPVYHSIPSRVAASTSTSIHPVCVKTSQNNHEFLVSQHSFSSSNNGIHLKKEEITDRIQVDL